MSSVDRRAALRILVGGGLGLVAAHSNLESLAKLDFQTSKFESLPLPQRAGFDFSPRLAIADGVAGTMPETGTAQRLAILSQVDAAPDIRSEIRGEFPAQVEFSLRVIAKGSASVEGTYYKVQGDGNRKEFYLYKALSNQAPQDPSKPVDPSKYERNTVVVARFVSEGNDERGQEKWRREEVSKSAAIIYGNVGQGECEETCPEAFIVVQQVDESANPIPGLSGDKFKIKDITPYVLCDRWGNWYSTRQAPTPIPPTNTPTATPTHSPTATPLPVTPAPLPRTGN